MPAQTARSALRLGLIEAAARLIAEGRGQLTVRRVADEAGTSTMAVYTHFGGMDGLRHAVRREGFARLATRLVSVSATDTDDPVADLALLGLAYFSNATDEPDLYRVMFVEPVHDAIDADIGWDTYDALARAVQRCIDAGRFRPAEARDLATQLWAVAHGTVTLHLAGLLSADEAIDALGALAFHLFCGYGDSADRVTEGLASALGRWRRLEGGGSAASPAGPAKPRRRAARRPR